MAGSERLRNAFSAFGAVQSKSGIPAIELVFRWALSVEGVDKLVIGASRPEQIEETMEMFRRGPLSADVQAELDRLAIPGFDWSQLYS